MTGPRQVGKTTLLRQLLSHKPVQQMYLWRTTEQQEIDYLEEINGKLTAYKFKWNASKRFHFPRTFTHAYPEATLQIISPANYAEFCM